MSVRQAVQEKIEFVRGGVYVRPNDGARVCYLGTFDVGDGQILHQFRDLRDSGAFFRYPEDVLDYRPSPEDS